MSRPVLILWVDPDVDRTAAQARRLEQEGWFVDCARDAVEALELAAIKSYDIVIAELLLRDFIATDLFDQIRQQYPGVKGIFTTDSPSVHQLVNPSGPNVLAYLRKPLDLEQLRKLIGASLPMLAPVPNPSAATVLISASKEWRRFATPTIDPGESSEAPLFFKKLDRMIAVWLAALSDRLAGPSVGRPALAGIPVMVSLLLFLTLLIGMVAGAASQQALPGDALYPLKTGLESASVFLAFDGKSRAELYLSLANRRASEIQQLVSAGRLGDVKQAAGAFEFEVMASVGELSQGASGGSDWADGLTIKFAEMLKRNMQLLTALREAVPAAASPDIDRAIAASQHGISEANKLAIGLPPAGTPVAVLNTPSSNTPTVVSVPTSPAQPASVATSVPPQLVTLTPTATPTESVPPPLPPAYTSTPTQTPGWVPPPAATATPTWTATATAKPTREPTETRPPTKTPRPTQTIAPSVTPPPPTDTPDKPGKGPKKTKTPKPPHDNGNVTAYLTLDDAGAVADGMGPRAASIAQPIEFADPLYEFESLLHGFWQGLVKLVYSGAPSKVLTL